MDRFIDFFFLMEGLPSLGGGESLDVSSTEMLQFVNAAPPVAAAENAGSCQPGAAFNP